MGMSSAKAQRKQSISPSLSANLKANPSFHVRLFTPLPRPCWLELLLIYTVSTEGFSLYITVWAKGKLLFYFTLLKEVRRYII